MPEPMVLAIGTRLDSEMRAMLQEASDCAGVEIMFWEGAESRPTLAEGTRTISLLIAALETGERRIPDALINLILSDFPLLPVLLLCKEPLVRKSITLQHGKISLLGLPLSAEKIGSRISMLVAESATGGFRIGNHSGQGVKVQEFRGLGWWAGTVTRHEDPDLSNLAPITCIPSNTGFSALICSKPARCASEALKALAQTENVSQLEHVMQGFELNTFICVEARISENKWRLHTSPGAQMPVWLLNPARLPACWNFSKAFAKSGRSTLIHSALKGDVTVALCSPAVEEAGPDTGILNARQLFNASLQAGAGVLEYLEKNCRHLPIFSAVVLEKR